MPFNSHKKCPNGHQYDGALYGDNCPFCPQSGTTPTPSTTSGEKTHVISTKPTEPLKPTAPLNDNGGSYSKTKPYADEQPGDRTVIRIPGQDGTVMDGRRVVGMLVSYTTAPTGDVFLIREGKTVVGRDPKCDIVVPDQAVSREHLHIVYHEANNRTFRLKDNMSSGGTFVNGKFEGDIIQLQANDVIIIGRHKFIFIPIPVF